MEDLILARKIEDLQRRLEIAGSALADAQGEAERARAETARTIEALYIASARAEIYRAALELYADPKAWTAAGVIIYRCPLGPGPAQEALK